jgi:hypothetical protein
MRVRVDTDTLRREAESELAQAQALHAQKLFAIDLLEARFKGSEPEIDPPLPAQISPPTPSVSTPSTRHVGTAASSPMSILDSLRPTIIQVLAQAGQAGATLADVAGYVTQRHKSSTRDQIARALYKLKKRGEVRLIREQSGLTAGLYALPD